MASSTCCRPWSSSAVSLWGSQRPTRRATCGYRYKLSTLWPRSAKVAGSDKEPTIKDYDDLEALACGEMSLTINYLYSLTARQFDNILRGYVKKQEDGIKVQMTLARELEFALISHYLYIDIFKIKAFLSIHLLFFLVISTPGPSWTPSGP